MAGVEVRYERNRKKKMQKSVIAADSTRRIRRRNQGPHFLIRRSIQNVVNDAPMHVGQAKVSTGIAIREFFVVDSQRV